MGFGGVTALGCTIGQGLSGLSTLPRCILTVLAIIGRRQPVDKIQLRNA
jgi:hypothetical protein